MSVQEAAETLSFPDEGPVSLNYLSLEDPFVPLWLKIIPDIIRVLDIVLKIWQPQYQSAFLRHPIQRYVLAISDDEAYMAKKTDSNTGGVFGDEGTAGSIIPGIDRRDMNLAPRWSGWLNELRNCLFQMLGLIARQRVLYAPEVSEFYPQLVSVVIDKNNLRAMEHRHFAPFLKNFVEVLLLSCPPPLYSTHVAPILGPMFEHIRYRFEKSWEPNMNSLTCKPLFTEGCDAAAHLASQNTDAWYAAYYARSGLFVGNLNSETADAALEKYRVEVTRTWSDVIQTALALKGEWALVLANLAKEGERKLTSEKKGPLASRLSIADGESVNADGTKRITYQSELDARRLQRINSLNHFLFLENETIAGHLILTVIQSLSYPDAYTCRRLTRICHRILETVAWQPRYTNLLGHKMLACVIKNLITNPKWMVGVQWDVINVFRDIYCRLVLGQILQFGGQGAGLQQNIASSFGNVHSSGYEQAKSAEKPLHGGGILTTSSTVPRQLLSSLPGISVAMINQMDKDLKTNRSVKGQRETIREFLRVSAENVNLSAFDRALDEESLLHNANKTAIVEDIPRKVTSSN